MAEAKVEPLPGKLAVAISLVTAPLLALTPVVAALQGVSWLKGGTWPGWEVNDLVVWLGLASERTSLAGLQAIFDTVLQAPLLAALPALGAAGAALLALVSKPPELAS
jgi:hypothetical protein